jgi:hypothetical protein
MKINLGKLGINATKGGKDQQGPRPCEHHWPHADHEGLLRNLHQDSKGKPSGEKGAERLELVLDANRKTQSTAEDPGEETMV